VIHPLPVRTIAGVGTVRDALAGPALLRRLALAQLGANVAIVVTGGAVRLTGSGLGCPTWPRCTDASYVVTRATGYHGVIEFSNRMLTPVLGLLAVACVVAALAQVRRVRARVRWSVLALAVIPAQAVLGGVVVLTHLNPWLVGGHFLLSVAALTACDRLWRAATAADAPATPVVPVPLAHLVRLLVGLALAVLVAGTVVTGSGPHSGDSARPRRTGLNPDMIAQLHTDLVMLLVGATVALYLAARATRAPARLVRATAVLTGVELAQGAIGFVAHFTGLPILLVALHMAGSCAVWLAALAVQAATASRPPAVPAGSPPPPDRAAQLAHLAG